MSKDEKNSNEDQKKIDFFHPDMLDSKKTKSHSYFCTHESTQDFNNNFPDLNSSELEIYTFIKNAMMNTFEAIWAYAKENADKIEDLEEVKQSIHDYFYHLKKLHLVEDTFLHHLEFSLILWLYSIEMEEDVANLQLILDEKFLPQADTKNDKRKISALAKSLPAHLAIFLEEKGATARQATKLSSELFGVSESVLRKIIPDIKEAYEYEHIEDFFPTKATAIAVVIIEMDERLYTIKRIVSDYQKDTINKSRAEHFNKTYEVLQQFIKESSEDFLNIFDSKDIELLNKNASEIIHEEEFKNVGTLIIEKSDSLDISMEKSKASIAAWMLKTFMNKPPNELFANK